MSGTLFDDFFNEYYERKVTGHSTRSYGQIFAQHSGTEGVSKANDAILSRRRDWAGAAFLMTKEQVAHWGDPPSKAGYWRYHGNAQWTFLGKEMPEGEPVYYYDIRWWYGEHVDFKAIPGTVVPKGMFKFLGVLAVLVVLFAFSEIGVFMGTAGILFLGLSTIGIQGFFSWQFRIEPVRATKMAALFTAAMAARTAHNAHEERQRHQADMAFWDLQRRDKAQQQAIQQGVQQGVRQALQQQPPHALWGTNQAQQSNFYNPIGQNPLGRP